MKKEFKISTWSIHNKMTVYVIIVMIFVAGIFSYVSMPREAFPEIVVPEIYVSTPYPGNSALDIEKLITRPLEKEINGISGVDDIISTSIEGFSTIQVKFDFSTTPTEALRKVKDKVDAATSDKDFPKDLPADPNVQELNFAELMPIMNINLSGDFSMDKLKEFGEYLEEEIEKVPEISKVDIRGIQDKEVEISVDLYKMETSKISFNDIAMAIQNENMTVSGGDLLENGIRRNVRVIGEFKSAKEIENIIIKQENNNIVYLRDIATVSFKEQEKQSYAREFSKPVVMLDVTKRAGENLIIASTQIDEILVKAKNEFLPSNLNVSKTNDQTNDTKTMVADLENSIVLGIILVVLVLLFFLGIRNALFVGIAIPLSMFMSFTILSALGVTLNTMVLFSLVIALGMLVDNGIVVVENVYRLLDEGYSKIDAAKYGVGEVAMPIIASTATTLAAFLPIAFWPGIMGEFMRYLPITLIIVLSSSLFVALLINPMLTSVYMKIKEDEVNFKKILIYSTAIFVVGVLFIIAGVSSNTKFLNALGLLLVIAGVLRVVNTKFLTPATTWFQTIFLPKLEVIYEKSLKFTLKGKRPKYYLFGTFGLLFLSFMLMGLFPPKILFFPETPPKQVYVYLEYPIGTDIEVTNALSIDIENKIQEFLKKYEVNGENNLITSVIGQVGEGTSDPNQGQQGGTTPNKARITVDFVKFIERGDNNTEDVLTEIRQLLQNYPGVNITVDRPSDGPPTGAPINIEISGDDYEELLVNAEDIKQFINEANIAGIEELNLDVEQGKPELPFIIDRQKARRLNISTGQIGDAIRTSLFGKEVSTFKDGEDDYPINIRLMDKYRYNKESLLNQKITFRNQSSGKIVQVPVSAVAHSETSSTFSAVKRKNLNRVITIFSNVIEPYNPTDVNEQIKKTLENYNLPKNLSISFTGEQEQQAEEMAFLSKALLIAVFLIFLILVGQFNSTSTPIIISIAVLLSLIGVLLGLIIFRMEFVIMMTMIGIISLAGIVVNNAIVLIDYTNLIMIRKREELSLEKGTLTKELIYESIVEGGKTRLRPVLLTAITTILGLLPLAIGININFMTLFTEFDPQFYIGGENVAFWGPMSWTIIFGLTFATFLTLIIVPVMYSLINNLKLRMKRKQ
ncbi:MAG: efflux RND transporter permease subunit [Lutibacter sp.]|uniref:efflux RND transporter permease subunit n=1 Tax=Lutibacter sp. TaxID=1925666 RepID=UPI001820F580|nr:efflux RND transporter permease subunit [Lutibacter sp.]MBT8316735.1 efflux RND transporter permease subunit [Lutibacter sp.]NNJ57595.1 efflux RND transporter permease subunit [Lutibacter sp.]